MEHLPDDRPEFQLLRDLVEERCRIHNLPKLKEQASELMKLIANKQDPELMRLEVLPVVVAMSQDVDENVRAAVSLCLDAVAMHAKSSIFNTSFINIIVDLINDTSTTVRRAAFDSFTNILTVMPTDMVSGYGMPIAKKFIMDGLHSSHVGIILTIALRFGKICLALGRGDVSGEDNEILLFCFQNLASIGVTRETSNQTKYLEMTSANLTADESAQCRYYCTENIIDVFVYFKKTDLDVNLFYSLQETFAELMIDEYGSVRLAAVGKLTEAYTFYQNDWGIFMNSLSSLLLSSDQTLKFYLPELGKILSDAINQKFFKKETDHGVWPLLFYLTELELRLSTTRDFRLYTQLLEVLELIVKKFRTYFFHRKMIEIFTQRLLSAKGLPMRLAIAKMLLESINAINDREIEASVRDILIKDLAKSNSFYDRMHFIKICSLIFDIFSSKYIKSHFYEVILEFAGDRVPNIRLAFAKLLPKLYKLWDPSDLEHLDKLERIINLLASDEDVDVRYELEAATSSIKCRTEQVIQVPGICKPKLEKERTIPVLKHKPLSNEVHNDVDGKGCNLSKPAARQSYFALKYSKILEKNRRAREAANDDSPSKVFQAHSVPADKYKGDMNGFSTPMSDREFFIDAGVSLSVTSNPMKNEDRKGNSSQSGAKTGVPIRQKQFSYRKPTISSLKRHTAFGFVGEFPEPKALSPALQDSSRHSMDEATLLSSNGSASSLSNNSFRKSSQELTNGSTFKSRYSQSSRLNGKSSSECIYSNNKNCNITFQKAKTYSANPRTKFPQKSDEISLKDDPDKKTETNVSLRRRPLNLNQESVNGKNGVHFKQRVVSCVDGRLGILREQPNRKQNEQISYSEPLKIDNVVQLDVDNNNRCSSLFESIPEKQRARDLHKSDAKDVTKRHSLSQLPRPLSGIATSQKVNKQLPNPSSRLPMSRLPERSGKR